MKKNFYAKLAWITIKKNRKIYLPYITASAGIIMLFYIILHLSMDSQVANFTEGVWIQLILKFGAVVIAVLAIILLFYTNSFLMKNRKRELGLYNVLGMGKMNLAGVMLWENIIVCLISIIGGLAFGILFSKAVQALLVKMVGGNIDYSFTVIPEVIIMTSVLFAVIFGIIFLSCVFSVGRLKTIELLYSRSKGEKEPKGNVFIAVAGVICLAVGYYMAQTVDNPVDAIVIFFFAVLLVIAGTFCTFISGSVVLFKMLKKNKNYYYKTKNFISTSSMTFRMKKHGAGLAGICILSTMVLVTLSSTACLYIGAGDTASQSFSRDISASAYFSGSNMKTLRDSEAVISKIIDDELAQKKLSAYDEVEYLMCQITGRFSKGELVNDVTSKINIVMLEEYNRTSSHTETLNSDEVLIACKDNSVKYKGEKLKLWGCSFNVKGAAENFQKRGEDMRSLNDVMYLVVSDQTVLENIYKEWEKSGDVFPCKLCVSYEAKISTADGKEASQNILQDVALSINERWNKSAWSDNSDFHPEYETCDFVTWSAQNEQRDLYRIYFGGLFFIGILLSIAFFGATVLIMYYKQITEGYDDKQRFEIMQKVGMTKKEIRESINSQVLTVFFAPLIVSGIHLAFAFSVIALMIKAFNVFNLPLLMQTTVFVFLIFVILYIIVYKITSKAYYKIVAVE